MFERQAGMDLSPLASVGAYKFSTTKPHAPDRSGTDVQAVLHSVNILYD